MSAIRDEKQKARHEARLARKGLAAAGATAGAEALAVAGIKLMDRLSPPGPVAGYWPDGSEMDVRPLLTDLDRRGYRLALPVVTAAGSALTFRQWAPGDPLVPGAHDIPMPEPEAPTLTPALVLVPLLAYDVNGYRLGQGGGFYDMTIAGLRDVGEIITVGVAFSGQLVRRVPREDHDERLDYIITDAGIWDRRHQAKERAKEKEAQR